MDSVEAIAVDLPLRQSVIKAQRQRWFAELMQAMLRTAAYENGKAAKVEAGTKARSRKAYRGSEVIA